MKICPFKGKRNDPSHTQFYVEVSVMQQWTVGGDGQFLNIYYPCTKVNTDVDHDTEFRCTTCGALAVEGK